MMPRTVKRRIPNAVPSGTGGQTEQD